MRAAGALFAILFFASIAAGAGGRSFATPDLTGKWIGTGFGSDVELQIVHNPSQGPNAGILGDTYKPWFCDNGGARPANAGEREHYRVFGGNFVDERHFRANFYYCYKGVAGDALRPPGWAFGGGDATVSDDGNTITFSYKDIGFPFGAGSGSYRRVLIATETRVDTATLDFAERAKKREAALKETAFALARHKDDLETKTLPAAKARADRAAEAETTLAPQIAEAAKLLTATRSALEALKRAEAEVPKQVKALLQAETFLSGRITKLETQILDKSGDVAKAKDERSRLVKQLREVEKGLAEKFAGTPLGDLRAQWIASQRSLEDVLFKLKEARGAAQEERIQAETDISKALVDRSKVDADLVDIVGRLAGFDPAVQEVTVEAAGKKVFHATSKVPFAAILKADREIAAAERAANELDAARKPIRTNFFAASRAAIASEQALAKLLNQLAWARFATDLGFDTYDIVTSFSKGGIVGALGEFGKKIAEKKIIPLLYEKELGDGIKKGSIEDEVNREFKAGLKNSWSSEAIVRVSTDRLIKDGGTKVVKVTAQQWTIEGLEKLGYVWAQRAAAGTFSPANAENLYDAGKELRKINGRIADLKKGINGISFKSVATSVFKDALKTGLKGSYDLAERNAWIDFFEKEATMRALSPLYFQATSKYWRAYENLENRLAAKAKLVAGLESSSGFSTTTSTTFKVKDALTITVKVAPHSGPEDLQLMIGNTTASAPSVKRTKTEHTLTYHATLSGVGTTVKLVLR